MRGSAKRQRTSPEFQFCGLSRRQAGDLHTLSGRKPCKYKPGTTQYHPASVCAIPFVRRQHARDTHLDRVTQTLGAASWLPLGRVRLDGPGAPESPKYAPAPDALALPDAKPLPAPAPDSLPVSESPSLEVASSLLPPNQVSYRVPPFTHVVSH